MNRVSIGQAQFRRYSMRCDGGRLRHSHILPFLERSCLNPFQLAAGKNPGRLPVNLFGPLIRYPNDRNKFDARASNQRIDSPAAPFSRRSVTISQPKTAKGKIQRFRPREP
ncbi:hypothetical protein [Paraburkholderia sp.]|uniref:hypothetical protein n=1 Tax=Paraburkholderia sp. TaxID=1926495 RepID=UPI0025FA1319|nr:hypothetical protein [Paraburkholderia sp.]